MHLAIILFAAFSSLVSAEVIKTSSGETINSGMLYECKDAAKLGPPIFVQTEIVDKKLQMKSAGSICNGDYTPFKDIESYYLLDPEPSSEWSGNNHIRNNKNFRLAFNVQFAHLPSSTRTKIINAYIKPDLNALKEHRMRMNCLPKEVGVENCNQFNAKVFKESAPESAAPQVEGIPYLEHVYGQHNIYSCHNPDTKEKFKVIASKMTFNTTYVVTMGFQNGHKWEDLPGHSLTGLSTFVKDDGSFSFYSTLPDGKSYAVKCEGNDIEDDPSGDRSSDGLIPSLHKNEPKARTN